MPVYCLEPIVRWSTRVIKTSCTTVDQIFTILDGVTVSVIGNTISDHPILNRIQSNVTLAS